MNEKQIMRKVEVIEGVVAEYNGQYWGEQHSDGQYTYMDFGEFDKAKISNPKYCKKPTDLTYDPENTGGYNPDYYKLKNARLIIVRKTITTEFEILSDRFE